MKIWINRAGQNLGTFTLEEVQRGLAQGQFIGTDLGWQEGMETWKPLSEFPGLQIPPASEPSVPTTPPPSAAPVSQTTLATVESREEGPAWEQRQTLGVGKALFETWKEILLKPDIAFSRMKTSGGFASPLLFNAVMVIIWAIFMLIYHFIFAGSFGAMANSAQADSSTMAALGVGTPTPFTYRNKGQFVNLGRYKAVAKVGNRTVNLTLSHAGGGALLGTPTSAVLTILPK